MANASYETDNYVLRGHQTTKSNRPQVLTNSQITVRPNQSYDLTDGNRSSSFSPTRRHLALLSDSSPGLNSQTLGNGPAGRSYKLPDNRYTRAKSGHLQGESRRTWSKDENLLTSSGNQKTISGYSQRQSKMDHGEYSDNDEELEALERETSRLENLMENSGNRLASSQLRRSRSEGVREDDWCVNPVHLTNSISPAELRSMARAKRLMGRSRSASPIEYPITEMDELAKQFCPVTMSAYKITETNYPTSDLMASAPPPQHLLPPAQSKWRVDGKIEKVTNKMRPSGGGRDSVDRMYTMVSEAPSIAASSVHLSSPWQQELASLRMERLRIEEDHLLEMKRQAELEKVRGPKPKWYELKTPQFHYEAHKNNELLWGEEQWQGMLDYRNDLSTASDKYQTLNSTI